MDSRYAPSSAMPWQQLPGHREGTVLGDIAVALLQGRTQASVAELRGLGDEWLSRRWKPVLLSLVLDRLLDAGIVERSKAA